MKIKTKLKTASAIALGITLFAGTAMAEPGASRKKGVSADADGDGQVTLEEYLAQAKERFAKIDSDNDGVITKEEAQALRGEMRKGRRGKGGPERDPASLFTDQNEDGVVTIDDVPERAARLFKRVDRDQDGSISAEENAAFQERAAKHGEKRGGGKGRKGKKGKKGQRGNN